MTPREFFYLVANMRAAQKEYFKTRNDRVFRACRVLEKQVDDEIKRVQAITA